MPYCCSLAVRTARPILMPNSKPRTCGWTTAQWSRWIGIARRLIVAGRSIVQLWPSTIRMTCAHAHIGAARARCPREMTGRRHPDPERDDSTRMCDPAKCGFQHTLHSRPLLLERTDNQIRPSLTRSGGPRAAPVPADPQSSNEPSRVPIRWACSNP